MQTPLKNRKKVAAKSLRSALKIKNILEEEGASTSRVKREQESTNLRAQKMMKGKVEPSTIPIVVRVMPPMVQALRQATTVPQMTLPQNR